MACKKKKDLESESRREFIKTLSGAAASAVMLGAISCKPGGGDNQGSGGNQPETLAPRLRKTNPFVTAEGKPILVSVQGTDFTRMLAVGLSALGGLDLLIADNQDVLINPNCNHSDPYPGICSIDSIVDIVNAVKQVTTGTVSVGDEGWESTSGVYSYLGLESAVSNAGGVPVNFYQTYAVRRDSWNPGKPSFRVFGDVYDTPVLISTCVLKRHLTASLTCAIKNNVGTISGSGMTSTRQYLHDSPEFLRELAEIAGLVNPELVIVDARSILTVAGPMLSNGGIVKDVGKVIICGDIVAADAYCARIMEAHDGTFSITEIEPTLDRAVQLGLGTSDLSQVEILEI
jgi:uncharacterized protein (DUF362 family)